MNGKFWILVCVLMLAGGVIVAGCGDRSDDGPVAETAKADADTATAVPTAKLPPRAEPAPPVMEAAPASDTKAERDVRLIVVYYFHRTLRCKTCLAIESQAKEAVERDFAKDVKQGRITWRVLNLDEEANKHFEKDFKLESSSVVLVETIDGKTAKWKDLPRVWDLVENKEAFRKYLSKEVAAYLR
ncbi:MAG: nitrophenyl compound nitroreductase subunit ArsF family protein [Planctomycetota bacterium]